MKLGIILYSNDSETVWNALRLAVLSLKRSDSVKIFLLAKGVEIETLDTKKFPITELVQEFIQLDGEIHACGVCLQFRESISSEMCPVSTMEDLHRIIEESDKVITF